MTPQQIVGLVVRLFAIWFVVQGLQMIGFGIAIDKQTLDAESLVTFGISAVLFLVAIALWFFPMVVAHKLVPETESCDVLRVPAIGAATVACVVLGLWIFTVHVIPALSRYLAIAVLLVRDHQPLSAAGRWNLAALVEGVMQLVIALLLTFKARSIANYFLLARPADDTEQP